MFRYIFEMDGVEVFDFDVSKQDPVEEQKLPAWLKLEFEQCAICPLKSENQTFCPAAIDVYKIIDAFNPHRSFDKVKVKVISPEREYYKECDIQTGLNSLLGLVMASSGCPVVSRLKPMAKFHLPFSTMEESLVRTLSFYLLEQLIISKKNGIEPDWSLESLVLLYEDLKSVNEAFLRRIKACDNQNDANLNAIIRFFTLSTLIPISISDLIESVGDIFPPKLTI